MSFRKMCIFIFTFIAANVAMANAVESKILTKDELILLLEERFATIDNYRCIMKIEVYNENGKTQYQKQKFIFKKPGMIYCEQLGPYKEGVVLTVDRDGKIVGCSEGILERVWEWIKGEKWKKSFKKEDNELKGITGETIFQSDWGYIINEMRRLKDGVDSYSIESQIIDGQGIYVFELTRAQEEFLFHIDKELMVIVKLERFLNDKMINSVVWEDIEINIELEDELFEI
ncbi:hypothetical protein E3J84_07690 [Candidatus Aerophobetes bacterium]|uniref:Outer membrane lipoprotein carrier protein LolA n=1 Tax=Aerophobetes bacterium TaxID=2030807 RepID=A0A523RN58_UNCAE|nr:MAG: hypothetical protein E3J84_07690 [Candidatus Aerophobetes bacterium]